MTIESVETYQGEGTNPAGDPQHVHDMIAKVETPVDVQEVSDTPKESQRPDWLPDKFNSVEDLARAYTQLEQQFHNSNEETQLTTEQERFQNEEVPEILETSPSQVHKLLDDRGLAFEVFQQEYNETGTLSKEALSALEEQGISEQVVATWIQGQEAVAEQTIQEIHNNVGGEDNYNLMMEWATGNLQPWEIDSFNSQIENLDANSHLAILGMYARYQNSEGIPPTLMSGDASDGISPRYESLAELTSAMSDPKYASDPAYRARVAQRLTHSAVL